MTTALELVNETKRHLGLQGEALNRLAAPVTSDATVLTFLYDLNGITPGAKLQVGLEVFHVWQVEPGSKSAVVESAQLGSPTSEHDQGDIVTVNPQYPDFTILRALNDDLNDLSSPQWGLYGVRSVDLTGTANRSGYDLAGVESVFNVIEVRYRSSDGSSGYHDWITVTNYDLAREVSNGDFPSGLALFLHDGIPPGRAVRVRYTAPFGTLTSLTDDVELVTGLPQTAHDLPPLGAAVALVTPREIGRNDTSSQGDTRRAEEVPPGAVAGSVNALNRRRMMRVQAEASKLAAAYPPRQWTPSPVGRW